MEIPKPTDDDFAWFRSIVPDDPRVAVKKMFGNEAAFINDQMFSGLFGSTIGLRLPPDAADELRLAGGGPFGPADRPMGGYVTLPEAWRGDPERCATWLERAAEHTATLPPKKKPAKKTPHTK